MGIALAGVLPALAGAADAPLLHAMFQDHAVLQRDRPIPVWGRAAPNQTVQVEFAGKRVRSRADADGHWRARLPALPAGGPYALSASAGGARQRIDDVLVGDVWLCSGQSNMELQLHRTLDARAEIAAAGNPRIRLLKIAQAASPVPLGSFGEQPRWQQSTPETARDFSAACFYFARELQKTVDVPMGLINASWGGSRIQAWTSGRALRASGRYDDELDVLALYASDPVAANDRWGGIWQAWWNARPGLAAGDAPWDPAFAVDAQWRDAPRELGAWEYWGVPELADFNGLVWYRTTLTLSAQQAAQDAVLALGAVDEIDQTWVNGRAVGSSYGADAPRAYPLPAGLLHEGDNTVAVAVLDTYRDGGIVGPSASRALRLADGSSVALDSAWKYRIVPGSYGTPPRAPWQSAAGLSTLHNGMIAPLGRYGLRGALWYQGESSTFEAERYRDLLRRYRDDLRAQFGAGLPLLVVQLANHGPAPTRPLESEWAQLREAQRQVAAEDPRSGLAVAIDIGDRYDIHPANKQELGRRLALAARHVVYGEALPASGPVPLSARREGEAIAVRFGDASDGLFAYGADGPVGFELCGDAAGSCRYASARIRGDEVLLRADTAGPATRVRYGWADSPVVTLYDGAGLPAGPFEMAIP
ncbi:beta galactosidase jelly roll domain-containing protein [Flavobacterium sp. MXW15]|uniref:Beta galactosidase jelly roll domain-containing protein n=1 Tax=Xanthomonas chitinilytica TaxID=2989819 RepID=A0ABT3JXT8_9XANT|nr:sialate O-acetylesterase [Xanthomonas sp. H13-6]MCW4455217.1 beta galactosidase jelly roll domain-containing protein [Flavobacterium sp. MXW15]MCW4473044.1 beta galactosidase jelly roll domain-containing protein [Xanthomonas sp. H13-6]